MPIYEFKCHDCDEIFERIVSFGTTTAACPKCDSPDAVTKLMSAFSFKSGTKFSSDRGSSCSGCASNNCSSCSR